MQSVLVQVLFVELAQRQSLSEGLVGFGIGIVQALQEMLVVLLHFPHVLLLLLLFPPSFHLRVHLQQLLAHTGHAVFWDLDACVKQ